MRDRWGIGAKLWCGFGVVILILAVVVGLYHYTVTKTVNGYESTMDVSMKMGFLADEVEVLMLQCRRNEKDFLLRQDEKYLKKLSGNIKLLLAKNKEISKLGRITNDQTIVEMSKKIEINAVSYLNAFNQLVDLRKELGLDHKSGIQGVFRKKAHALGTMLSQFETDSYYMEYLLLRRWEKDFHRTGAEKYGKRLSETLSLFIKSLEKTNLSEDVRKTTLKALIQYKDAYDDFKKALTDLDKDKAYAIMRKQAHTMEIALKQVFIPQARAKLLQIRRHEKDFLLREDNKYASNLNQKVNDFIADVKQAGILAAHQIKINSLLQDYQNAFNRLVIGSEKTKQLKAKLRSEIHKIEPVVNELAKLSQEKMNKARLINQSQAQQNAWLALALGSAAGFLGLVLAWFITRSITKPVNQIKESLESGTDQVASASDQVSSSAQNLAQGSSEQAASLEEISSSLEEMDSMAKINAKNADQADALMKQAQNLINDASQSMTEMAQSMDQIALAGQQIREIVKSIDEIAFQTNLLALNAAVEAARAQEAGAGFAVVADEVRSLALRAAESAKSTQELVTETVKSITNGANLVKRTQSGFLQVIEASKKVGGLVGEIAEASKEQTLGIGQVNKAMSQIDQVTQQVAANAEESAASSEELNAQASYMKHMVEVLSSVVSGKQGLNKRVKAPVLDSDDVRFLPPEKKHKETPQFKIS